MPVLLGVRVGSSQGAHIVLKLSRNLIPWFLQCVVGVQGTRRKQFCASTMDGEGKKRPSLNKLPWSVLTGVCSLSQLLCSSSRLSSLLQFRHFSFLVLDVMEKSWSNIMIKRRVPTHTKQSRSSFCKTAHLSHERTGGCSSKTSCLLPLFPGHTSLQYYRHIIFENKSATKK